MDVKTMNRFFEKVKKTPDCWLWVATKINGGYGHFRYGKKKVLAHRFSWVIEHGVIPKGMNVLHKCDVRNCVNPDHLFIGTIQDNVRDMYKKGRGNDPKGDKHYSKTNPELTLKGERNGRSKLTQEIVNEIRKIYRKGEGGEFSQRALAAKYGVSHSQIGLVVRNKSWIEISIREVG